MQAGETAAARRADLEEMRELITQVGQRLNLETRPEGSALLWVTPGNGDQRIGVESWRFYLMASSLISRYVLTPPPRPPGRMVVLLRAAGLACWP